MSDQKAKRGRVPGSSTPDRPVCDWQPPQCPHCGAVTDPMHLRYKREIVGDGIANGRPYSRVTLWHADCGACRNPLVVRQHEFIPGGD